MLKCDDLKSHLSCKSSNSTLFVNNTEEERSVDVDCRLCVPISYCFFQILVDVNYVKKSRWRCTFGTNSIREVNIAVAAAPSLPFSSTLVTIVNVDCETRRRTWAPPRAPPRPPGDLGWWCRCSRRAQGGQAPPRFATTGTCVAPSGKVCCYEQYDRNWKQ